MNNKDILKRARQEKNDEREAHIRIKAYNFGWLSVSAVILFLTVFRSIYNESSSDILMIVMTQIAAVSFYQYFN